MTVYLTDTPCHGREMDTIETTQRGMTVEDLLDLPVSVGIEDAGRAFGISRGLAYRMQREGRFPVPVLRIGRRLVVTRASLLNALGVTNPGVPLPSSSDPAAATPLAKASDH